jgi:Methyltransferase domain
MCAKRVVPLNEILEIFRTIYREERWGGYDESIPASGSGSAEQAVTRLREMLPKVLHTLDVSTMLDAPCGDLNWMRPADLPLEKYIGVDIVPELVEHARRIARGVGEFKIADITVDPLPRADLIFCRDCLGHLPDELGLAALRNMQASGGRFLMATTFYAVNENLPCGTGSWRPINLQLQPFSLPPPLLLIPEATRLPSSPFFDKSMGVWELESLTIADAY